jgi:hypothetical protein
MYKIGSSYPKNYDSNSGGGTMIGGRSAMEDMFHEREAWKKLCYKSI